MTFPGHVRDSPTHDSDSLAWSASSGESRLTHGRDGAGTQFTTENDMPRSLSLLATSLLVATLVTACGRNDPPPPATSSAPAASPTTPSSTAAVSPSPSDAPKGSMTSAPSEAGSALGGTAPGNVTDPKPNAPGGAVSQGGAPQPTGGDGSKEAAKAEADAKAAPAKTTR